MRNTVKKIVILVTLLIVVALLIFTSIRHETKPAALSRKARERIEALDDAVKNGLISRSEYQRRVAQIQANDGPPTDSGARDDGDDAPSPDPGQDNKPSGQPTAP
jgi:hypothetical protein